MRPLLALFIRALREDVRSKGTYILRTALVLLILFFLWTTHQSARWTGAVGRQFFTAVLWIDLFIVSVAGLGYFASAITEEKEDGTLGLLRMTDLDALAILLGKSTGRLIGALFLLAAQIPFALVAATMGGVSVGQILAGYGCLLSFTFLLANVGLLASVVCRRSGPAAAMAGGGVLAFALVPTWLQWAQGEFARQWPWLASVQTDRFIEGWWQLTPIARLLRILRTGFNGAPLDAQAIASVLIGLACFALAWALFEPFTVRALDGVEAAGSRRSRRSGRTQGLGAAALAAKEFRAAGGWRATLLKIGVSVLAQCVWAVQAVRHDWSAENVGVGLFFTSAVLLLLFTSLNASRVFRIERQQKTLTTLCALPLSAQQIALAKLRGCTATDWPPLLPMALGASLLLPDFVKELGRHDGVYFFFAAVHAVLTGMLLPVFIAWLSLRVNRGSFAVGATVWFMGNWIVAGLFAVMFQEAAFVILPFIAGWLLVLAAKDIPRRIERLAGEE